MIICRASFYTFATSGKNYEKVYTFRVSLDDKTKSNLKNHRKTKFLMTMIKRNT